jgi:hypothetical protein
MANRTATLYIRITKNGRDSFRKPVYQSKGRLKPQYAMVNGEPEHHKEGVYYVRFGADGGKQQFVLVGKDPYVALDKLEEKKRWPRADLPLSTCRVPQSLFHQTGDHLTEMPA